MRSPEIISDRIFCFPEINPVAPQSSCATINYELFGHSSPPHPPCDSRKLCQARPDALQAASRRVVVCIDLKPLFVDFKKNY